MKKNYKKLILMLIVFPMLLTGSVKAESTEPKTLRQAVQAAQTTIRMTAPLVGQVSSIPDAAQANTSALTVAEVVIDIDIARKKFNYLGEKQEMLKLKVEKASNDFKMGKINAKALDELRQEAIINDFDLNHCKMLIDNGQKEYQRLTGTPISVEFDYEGAYLIVDAGGLTLPPNVAQGKDAKELERQLSDVVASFSSLGSTISAYIDSGEKLAAAENEFKTGKVTNDELEAVKAGMKKARINAFEGKAQYSKLLFRLDCSLHGFISREVKKISDPIFQLEITSL